MTHQELVAFLDAEIDNAETERRHGLGFDRTRVLLPALKSLRETAEDHAPVPTLYAQYVTVQVCCDHWLGGRPCPDYARVVAAVKAMQP